jgi:uncharacterized protein YdcH (DUF465 family)
MTDHVQDLRRALQTAYHMQSASSSLTSPGKAAEATAAAVTPRSSAAAHSVHSPMQGPPAMPSEVAKLLSTSQPESSAREQLESLLSVMKMLRKQNGILHSVICDRGSLLRHFAWLLVHHGILPANYDVTSIAGDQSAELRIAFAERDEELFMKDQALLQRCTEVVLLERSCRDLAAQLQQHSIEPLRPVPHISDAVMRAQRQTQRDVLNREQSRARMHERHAVLLQETKEVDTMLMAFQTRLDEVDGEMQAAEKAMAAPHATASTVSARKEELAHLRLQRIQLNDEIVAMRVKKDQLANAVAIVDAQCSAHEDEVRLLRQVLAQSTRVVTELQQQAEEAQSSGGGFAHRPSASHTASTSPAREGTAEDGSKKAAGMFGRLRAKFLM